MFDVSSLTVKSMVKPAYGSHQFAVYYTYNKPELFSAGLAYVTATDELGAYQGLLKQLEERYKNG